MTAVAAPPLLSRRLVALLAFTAGAAVANIYYVQPLLDVIGRAFGVGEGTAGLLVTAAQAGYLVGLALLVPLGDLLERRRLIAVMLLGAAVASAAAAVAPSNHGPAAEAPRRRSLGGPRAPTPARAAPSDHDRRAHAKRRAVSGAEAPLALGVGA